MPRDGKTQTYGFLDQLSTKQLLDLVRADSESSENGDYDLTIRILEVIEKREKEKPTGLLSDVDQAWEDFQTYFNTPDGKGRSLYPVRDSDLTAVEEHLNKSVRRRHRRLAKRLLSLAAALAVAFSSMVAAQAFGFDVFGALARWTSETFHFATEADTGSPESERLQTVVQAAFDRCDITDIPAPAWYPMDSKLVGDIDVVEAEESLLITCCLTCNDNFWSIIVQKYYESDRIPNQTFEKDASNIEEYSSNGRSFYIMSNLSYSRAVYSNDQTVMTVEGMLALEHLKQIIDSIGE